VLSKKFKNRNMKNVITAIQNAVMWITLLIVGVSIVSFALKTMVWFVGMMLIDPIHALGYLCLGVILCIGASTAIDKMRG
jgi:hypothetical protein